jgi:OmpA-OmpF porin, OOP family
MFKRIYFFSISLILLLLATTAIAVDLTQDIPNAVEIPDVPRFAQTVLIGFEHQPAATTKIPIAAWKSRAKNSDWEDALTLEGEVLHLLYLAPPRVSSLEVMQHYQQHLANLGYHSLFQCAGTKKCGQNVGEFYSDAAHGKQLSSSYLLRSVYSAGSVQDPRVQVVQRLNNGSETYLFIFAAVQDNYADSAAGERVAIFIEAVTRHPLPTPSAEPISAAPAHDTTVTNAVLNATELAQHLAENGRAVLYGIEFDDAQTTLRPEATAQLEQIAALLKQNSQLTLYIVGHSDNDGNLKQNLQRSQQRASTVMQALIQRYDISAARLSATGMAHLAPVATNANAAGRARNRRLELVAN